MGLFLSTLALGIFGSLSISQHVDPYLGVREAQPKPPLSFPGYDLILNKCPFILDWSTLERPIDPRAVISPSDVLPRGVFSSPTDDWVKPDPSLPPGKRWEELDRTPFLQKKLEAIARASALIVVEESLKEHLAQPSINGTCIYDDTLSQKQKYDHRYYRRGSIWKSWETREMRCSIPHRTMNPKEGHDSIHIYAQASLEGTLDQQGEWISSTLCMKVFAQNTSKITREKTEKAGKKSSYKKYNPIKQQQKWIESWRGYAKNTKTFIQLISARYSTAKLQLPHVGPQVMQLYKDWNIYADTREKEHHAALLAKQEKENEPKTRSVVKKYKTYDTVY